MTDKQIIIDGCDVSGCNRLNTFPMQYGEPHEICLTSLEQWGGQEKYCKDRPNCYYKQLLRKEQECEELKGISMKKCPKCGEVYLNSVGMEAFNQLDQLKAQLLDQEAETLKAGGIIHKLSKTLTEIKEIAERGFKYSQCNCGAKADLDLILQKISECEVK